MSSDRQLIVVANRLPVGSVRDVRDNEGEQQWVTGPRGLVSALAPALIQGRGPLRSLR